MVNYSTLEALNSSSTLGRETLCYDFVPDTWTFKVLNYSMRYIFSKCKIGTRGTNCAYLTCQMSM